MRILRIAQKIYPEAGDGPLRESLEAETTERGLTDAVTFLGHIPYD